MSEHGRMWIGGSWVDAADGAAFEAFSPSTGEVIGTVPEGSREDAQRAIDAANAAAPRLGTAVGLRPRGRDAPDRRRDRRAP